MKDSLEVSHVDEKQQPRQPGGGRSHARAEADPSQQEAGGNMGGDDDEMSGTGLIPDGGEGPPLRQRGDGTPGAMLAVSREEESRIFGQHLVVAEGLVVVEVDAVMPQFAEADAGDGDDEGAIGNPGAGDNGILDAVGWGGDLAALTDQSV